MSKYPIISLALTNVDFMSDATHVSALIANFRTNMWGQRLVIVIKRGKILEFNLLYYAFY
jgi:hypothetical protein